MDRLQELFYEKDFRLAFLQCRGGAFQTFFERLMGLAYKANFMACRPWGNQGDRKNDGFLKSERRLFQVYAPNELEAAKAIAKITEDFEGARVHWGVHFDKWVFVHNATDGLPAHVQALLLDFEKANPGITLEPWGLEELLQVLRMLSLEDLESWFGVMPSEETKQAIGFADLRVVLETIADRPVAPPTEVRAVPSGKIEANALSDNVAALLKAGMTKAPLVDDFFSRWHDETFGERVAASFRAKYEALRGNSRPDEIFAELEAWAGGRQIGTPKKRVAVLAVLAYFFDSCDIFEEPRATTP